MDNSEKGKGYPKRENLLWKRLYQMQHGLPEAEKIEIICIKNWLVEIVYNSTNQFLLL